MAQEKLAPLPEAERRIKEIVANNRNRLWFGSGSDWMRSLPEIDDVADQALRDILAQVDEKVAINLIEVINHRRKQLPLSSSTGSQITALCGQLLAFGAAGLALAIGFADKIANLPPPLRQMLFLLGIFYTLLVIVSLFVIFAYLLQATFRYPYLYFEKIGNAWPFFYYSSISSGVSRFPIQTPRGRLTAAGLYADDLLRFADKCVNESVRERLRNELQQYFLLIAYQGYSHQFSLRLGNTFIYGLAGAIVATLMTALVAMFVWR
jgi:hypothetical protein